jgi:HSP20 family molecular chaperone IbpA
MRKSQIVVLSALGAVALLIVGAVVGARIIGAQLASGEYSEESSSARRSGPLASESRDLSGFDRVEARGTWEIDIERGDAWDVELAYPESAEDLIDVRVENGRLVLEEERRGWSWFGRPDETFEATITMPALAGIDLSGATELTLSGFSGDQLEVTASGAMEIDGTNGSYRELTLIVSGAGQVDFDELVVEDARVVLSGAGEIKLNMNGGVLSGNVSGAGNITYRGTVREENVVTSGFSSVEAAD